MPSTNTPKEVTRRSSTHPHRQQTSVRQPAQAINSLAPAHNVPADQSTQTDNHVEPRGAFALPTLSAVSKPPTRQSSARCCFRPLSHPHHRHEMRRRPNQPDPGLPTCVGTSHVPIRLLPTVSIRSYPPRGSVTQSAAVPYGSGQTGAFALFPPQ